jgi:hypothetical protein
MDLTQKWDLLNNSRIRGRSRIVNEPKIGVGIILQSPNIRVPR